MKAAGIDVEPIWPSLFAKALEGQSLHMNVFEHVYTKALEGQSLHMNVFEHVYTKALEGQSLHMNVFEHVYIYQGPRRSESAYECF